MTPAAARDLTGRLLLWLASDHDRIGAFLAATGLDPSGLRGRLQDPGLHLAILDHLMADEALLRAACHDLGLPPEAPGRAQIAMGGGPAPHWT